MTFFIQIMDDQIQCNGGAQEHEWTWIMQNCVREVCEDLALQYAKYLIERSQITVPWLESRYNLFPKGKHVWNIQKIVFDKGDDWDGNIKLLLVKEKLGLVKFYKVTCYGDEDFP